MFYFISIIYNVIYKHLIYVKLKNINNNTCKI